MPITSHSWLCARRKSPNRWHVWTADLPPQDAVIRKIPEGKPEICATELTREACRGVRGSIYWFEWSNHVYMSARGAVCAGDTLATWLVEVPRTGPKSIACELPPLTWPDGARRYALVRMSALGLQRKPRRVVALQCLGWTLSAALAPLLLALLLLRFGGDRPGRLRRCLEKDRGNVVFALHAEDSGRVRHLREAMTAFRVSAGTLASPILLLGRPRADRRCARSDLDPRGELADTEMIRPVSLASMCFATPAIGLMLWRGLLTTWQNPLPMRLRDQFAIAFRVALGAAQAHWWNRAAPDAAVALFGHTGTADTSQLELAMQDSGTVTAHIAHGTNLGIPFAGLSDFGFFQSQHDAVLAQRLPAYRRALSLPLARAPLHQGDSKRWLVLTSYTHPLNDAYRVRGAEPDMSIIRMVQAMAKSAQEAPEQVVWRPHPMLAQCREGEIGRLRKLVEEAGFSEWRNGGKFDELTQFGVVITTPSSTLIDCLRLGKLPLLAIAAPLQSDLVYGDYPLVAYDAREAAAALRAVALPDHAQALYDFAWDSLQPGASPDVHTILSLMSGG